MKKKIVLIEEEYEEKIKEKTPEEIEKINEEIMERCKQVVKKENEKFYDEKLKNYEKFKNTSLDNKTGILKLKKILLLRTHSKKTKRRGRKRKIPYDNIINNITDKKNKNLKLKKIRKNMKYITPLRAKKINKKKESLISNENEFSVQNENIMPLKEEDDYEYNEENINERKNEIYYGNNIQNMDINNPYINIIKETPSFQNNNFIGQQNCVFKNINETESKDKIIKEDKIFFSVLRNENNLLNNSISNMNSHQRTNCESTDIKNNNSTTNAKNNIINKFINPTLPLNNINSLNNLNNFLGNKNMNFNMNMNMNINMNINMNNLPSSSEKKSNNSGSSSNLKDIRLTTPIKLSTVSRGQIPYKPFNKNEGAFNCISTENALEKSAFNKQVIVDNPYPYSNIKTHLCFTSSIKKPVKIISYENNNQEPQLPSQQNVNGSGNKNNVNNNLNNNINNYFQNIENMTPNKVIEFSGSSSSDGLRFKNIGISSSKKKEFVNLNSSSGRIDNNPFNDFTPNKNATPFKISNANLNKMFFSNINSKNKA